MRCPKCGRRALAKKNVYAPEHGMLRFKECPYCKTAFYTRESFVEENQEFKDLWNNLCGSKGEE